MVDDMPPAFSDPFSGAGGRKCLRENQKETAGPSTTLSSGRDDNSVEGKCLRKGSNEWLLVVQPSQAVWELEDRPQIGPRPVGPVAKLQPSPEGLGHRLRNIVRAPEAPHPECW
jgi:hypothetical protein